MKATELEKLMGYSFKNKSYLETALTHSSYIIKEKRGSNKDNERLEFLGDAFFDAIISARLYDKMTDVTEGRLTKTRAVIVCESSLANVAKSFRLGEFLYMGNGEHSTGGRKKDSILADALEAIMGAIYLDGGYEEVEKFVVNSFSETIDKAVEGKLFSDYKSEIQEQLQKKGKAVSINYVIDREEGPAHDKTFYVHIECNGEVLGDGMGKSKKEAEQNAAKMALERGVY